MGGDRVRILVSGQQDGGEEVTPDAVRWAYAELARRPASLDVLREFRSVTGFALETLADGRVAITGRLELKYGQPRSVG